tara:strand:+ start:70 stop:1017 length:948 start_codon:yes stop_codon:yes gene_type:complete
MIYKKLSHIVIAISVFLLGCNKVDISGKSQIELLNKVFGVKASTSSIKNGKFFFKDISYGKESRNKLDILLPQNPKLNGVVIFFHGGGFERGDKADVFDDFLNNTIESILNKNIALVSANYTFIDTPGTEGVISALKDGTSVISFIKNNSEILQLPKNKIILAGVSAGAGIAQWNGFRESSNDQIEGVLALAAQSTYDLYQWENIFQDFSLEDMRIRFPDMEETYIKFYNGEPSKEGLKYLDYRSEMDSQDPPLYIYNPINSQDYINSEGTIDFNVLYHSFRHGDYLREKAIEVGQEFSGAYQESPEDFILRLLN